MDRDGVRSWGAFVRGGELKSNCESAPMIRKVLVSSINYDHPQRGLIHAFRGIFGEVAEYDFLERQRQRASVAAINEELVNLAVSFKPDLCFFQLQETGIIKAEAIARIKTALPKSPVVHWMGDMRMTVPPYLASISRECHVTLCSSVGQIPAFMAAGAKRTLYSQVGLDWHEDVMGIPDWAPTFRVPDVVFLGNYYGATFPGSPERILAVATLLREGIDVGIVGTGWPKGSPVVGRCEVKQQTHVYRRAKVALSVNNFNDVELFYSDRHLIALASGTPLVSRYVPGLEREFDHGKHLLWFKTQEDLVAAVKGLLGDENFRRRVGREGRAEAIKNHTWFSRILALLPVVEEEAQKL